MCKCTKVSTLVSTLNQDPKVKHGRDYYLCEYCKEFFCWDHSYFIPYNQDTTIDECNGMKRCCNNKFCVSRFKHEKQIKRQSVLNDFDQTPRKYFNLNQMTYLFTWLDRKDHRTKIPRFADPYRTWE